MTDETTTRKITVEEYCAGQTDATLRDMCRLPAEMQRNNVSDLRTSFTPIEPWHERRAAAAAEELVRRHDRHQRELRAAELRQAQERRDRAFNHPQRRREP
jgi:hypothetical protein